MLATTPHCNRCGDSLVLHEVNDRRCQRCRREVDNIIRLDEARRNRFARVKDLTPTPLGAA